VDHAAPQTFDLVPRQGTLVRKSVVQVFAGKAPPAAHTGRMCKGGNAAGGRLGRRVTCRTFPDVALVDRRR
jgi:hypothetical protein